MRNGEKICLSFFFHFYLKGCWSMNKVTCMETRIWKHTILVSWITCSEKVNCYQCLCSFVIVKIRARSCKNGSIIFLNIKMCIISSFFNQSLGLCVRGIFCSYWYILHVVLVNVLLRWLICTVLPEPLAPLFCMLQFIILLCSILKYWGHNFFHFGQICR